MSVRRHVLREEVEELILQRLMENRWEPGSRISIDGLARTLEVSPTPVREAMVSLERSGLVEYVALRGYVVSAMLDAQQINELLDTRMILETAALGASFEQWPELVADLEIAQDRHTQVIATVDAAQTLDYELVREHFEADWAFHQSFFDHANNRYLRQMVENLRTHTHRMRQTWAGGPAMFDGHQAHAEHRLILERVRDDDQDGAMRSLADHLAAVRHRSLPTDATHWG